MATKSDIFRISKGESAELLEAVGNRQDALQLAITVAEERAKKYILPCQWVATWEKGAIKVVRQYNCSKHNKRSYLGS